MSNMTEIIKNRAAPGILLFDLDDRLLFSNGEALNMLTAINLQGSHSFAMPSEIYLICRQVKEGSQTAEGRFDYPVMQTGKFCCSLRGFLLDSRVGNTSDQIMILMERVVAKHEVDIEKVNLKFLLTRRETEVVAFLCKGMGNRGISERLSISEHTVKDHIKNIMKKMQVGTRYEMMALLN